MISVIIAAIASPGQTAEWVQMWRLIPQIKLHKEKSGAAYEPNRARFL